MHRFWAALAIVLPVVATINSARSETVQATGVLHPDWIKKPTDGDLERFWPAAARGVSGQARIKCIVTGRGLMDKCVVVSESPAGLGFGGAALLMAPLFVMRPETVDGVPMSGAGVVIPINFKTDRGGPFPPSADAVRVANNLPWRAVPTAADLAAAFPQQTAENIKAGHVVLRCRVAADGALKACETATEEPRGDGFAKAARALVKTFRVADEVVQSKAMHDIYVDVPFDFRDPRQPGPPVEVNAPEWLRGADPAMAGRLFPEAAAKAGLKTGRAIVACEAAQDGTLTHCAVASEDPPGLGFGSSALAIAGVMQMNPWTKQGAPVEGAKIRLPIRLNLGDDAPSAKPAAPSQTSPAPPSRPSASELPAPTFLPNRPQPILPIFSSNDPRPASRSPQ